MWFHVLIFLIASISVFLIGEKIYNRNFNPISIWAIFWLFPIAIACIPFTPIKIYTINSDVLKILYISSFFCLLGLLIPSFIKPSSNPKIQVIDLRQYNFVLCTRVLLLLKLMVFGLIVALIGSVPILSDSPLLCRKYFKFKYHLIYSIYNYFGIGFLFYSMFYIVGTSIKMFDKILIFATLIVTLTTLDRGPFLFNILFIILPILIFKKIKMKFSRIIIVSLILIAIFYVIDLFRTKGNPISLLSPESHFLFKPYLYIKPNFVNFYYIYNWMENNGNFKFGAMTFRGIFRILHVEDSLGLLNLDNLIPLSSYNLLTALAPLYVDGGIIGVIIGMFLIGFFTSFTFMKVFYKRVVSCTEVYFAVILLITIMYLFAGLPMSMNSQGFVWFFLIGILKTFSILISR